VRLEAVGENGQPLYMICDFSKWEDDRGGEKEPRDHCKEGFRSELDLHFLYFCQAT